MGPVDGPRNRSSRMLRVAVAIALAIVLLLGIATSRWRTSATSTTESPPTARSSETLVPTSIDSTQDPDSLSAIRRAAAAPAPAPTAASSPLPADAEGIRVVGEVRDPSGQHILATPATVRYTRGMRSLTAPISEGEFVIAGLIPGSLGLDCIVKGYRPQSMHTLLRPGVLEQRFDFVLDPLWMVDVELRTTEGKDPMRQPDGELRLASLNLRVTEDPPPDVWSEDTAESRRALRLVSIQREAPRAPGAYARIALLRDPPAYLSVDTAGHVLAATRLEAGAERTTLVVSPEDVHGLRSSFTCTVVDRDDGTPITAVKAIVFGNGVPGRRLPASDESGRIRASGLPSGHRMLMLESEGRSKVIRTLELRPGVETDLGVISLDPSLHVRGRFVNERGRAIPPRVARELCQGLAFLPFRPDDPMGSEHSEWISRIEAQADGSFEGEGFGRERYLLMNRGFLVPDQEGVQRIRPMVVDCTRGSVDDLVVTMERVFRIMLRPEVDEARDLGFSILDANGLRLDEGDLKDTRMEWLASGTYLLRVGTDSTHVREIPFTVGSEPLLIPIEP